MRYAVKIRVIHINGKCLFEYMAYVKKVISYKRKKMILDLNEDHAFKYRNEKSANKAAIAFKGTVIPYSK